MKKFQEYKDDLADCKGKIKAVQDKQGEILARPITNKEKETLNKSFKDEIKSIQKRKKEIDHQIRKLKKEKGMLKSRKSEIYNLCKTKEEIYTVEKNSKSEEFLETVEALQNLKDREIKAVGVYNDVMNFIDSKDELICDELLTITKNVLKEDGYVIVNKNIKKKITRDDRKPVETSTDSIIVINPKTNVRKEISAKGPVSGVIERLGSVISDETHNKIINEIGDFYLCIEKEMEDFNVEIDLTGVKTRTK